MMPPATIPQHVTKQQFVYDLLRNAIIHCELPPGERLVIDDLAKRYRVSIIPVREALRLLQSEGLVVSVAHTGTSVAPISAASVDEIFSVLEALEVVSTRRAATRASSADLGTLTSLIDQMDAAIAAHRPTDWADLNSAFHLAIGRLAGMPLLDDLLRRAFDNWDRLRRQYFSGVLAPRIPVAQAEHHRLVEQITACDLSGLEATIRAHNQAALASYSAFLEIS